MGRLAKIAGPARVAIGAYAEQTRYFTAADVAAFVRLFGDTNPRHRPSPTPRGNGEEEREGIVHGAMLNAHMTALCGCVMPGAGSVLIDQSLRYLHPVRVDTDAFTARVEVIEIERRRPIVRIATPCTVDGRVAMDGTATVLIPRDVWRLARHHMPPSDE